MTEFLAFLVSPAGMSLLSVLGTLVTTVAPTLLHVNGINLGPISSLLNALNVTPVAPSNPATPSTPTLTQLVNDVLALLDSPATPTPAPSPVTPSPATPATTGGPLRSLLSSILSKRHNLPAGSTTLNTLVDQTATQISQLVTPTAKN